MHKDPQVRGANEVNFRESQRGFPLSYLIIRAGSNALHKLNVTLGKHELGLCAALGAHSRCNHIQRILLSLSNLNL